MIARERRLPSGVEIFLDHVGHFVPDREAARHALMHAGFASTPVSVGVNPDGNPTGTGNVTAMFTLQQVQDVVDAVKGGAPTYISVFAGRIADTGGDPVPLMEEAVRRLAVAPNTELIWASPRELLNIFQADAIGCHIITVTNDILKKLSLVGKDLGDYSLETVKMFYDDGRAAGFAL